jgi:hypothetical protein
MAETQVLAGEPRHKTSEFRDEFLERRRQTVQDMRPQLRGLVAGLLRAFEQVADSIPGVDLSKLRVEDTTLTKDGKMTIAVSTMGLGSGVKPGDLYYVDDLVGEMFEGKERWSLVSYEVGQFISALVNQFAFIRKRDESFQPSQVTFGEPRWSDGLTVFDVRYAGKPLGLKSAGW